MKKSIKKFEQFEVENTNNIKGGTADGNGNSKYYLEVAKASKLQGFQ